MVRSFTDLTEEGLRIVNEAETRGAILRVIGGAAIWLHTQKERDLFDILQRPSGDLDFVGYKKNSDIVKKTMTELGFQPNQQLNAFHGQKRQLWYTADGQIDIVFNILEMCHVINFEKRLELDKPTVPVSDLFLSKIQIVNLNDKDVKDILILLREHGISDAEGDSINSTYIARLLANDWGFYYTTTVNLQKVRDLLPNYKLSPDDVEDLNVKIDLLRKRIDEEPKSFGWKMREKVGTKKRWYNVVEEVIR